MLFNSLQFFIFFGIVYVMYLRLGFKAQNIGLLLVSYIFYAAWDWRFLSLLWISTIVDFFCGHAIADSEGRKKKIFLGMSIFVNLSLLGFFKYFNFFVGSLYTLMNQFGFSLHALELNIILPVGISFYTFQTMSYSIDVYYGKIKPTKSFLNFSLFVAFFPQLVAGPIERARNLLPQMEAPRTVTLEKFYEGCFLIFWGLFLKVFIADNLARLVDPVFASTAPYKSAVVLGAVYSFAFQIFCDFAGYSNMARGLAKCMGFEIMVNFNLPYFATNPSDFWKRWHISLSTWLRDYLYIPLGGNQKGKWFTYRNLFITMLLGGLWHGAAWTFIFWGLYHSFLLIVHRLLKNSLVIFPNVIPAFLGRIWYCGKIFFFFHLTCFGWLIFRAQSVKQIGQMTSALFTGWDRFSFYEMIYVVNEVAPFVLFLLIVQFYQFRKKDLMAIYKLNFFIKGFFYFACLVSFIIFGVPGAKEFIYFQF